MSDEKKQYAIPRGEVPMYNTPEQKREYTTKLRPGSSKDREFRGPFRMSEKYLTEERLESIREMTKDPNWASKWARKFLRSPED
jgi:hypothetical protein